MVTADVGSILFLPINIWHSWTPWFVSTAIEAKKKCGYLGFYSANMFVCLLYFHRRGSVLACERYELFMDSQTFLSQTDGSSPV